MAKKQKNKKKILFRFGCFTVLCLVVAAIIVVKLFLTSVVHKAEWDEAAQRQLDTVEPVAPERGSILASNGSILACNVMVWDLYLDMAHPKINRIKGDEPWKSIDSLADWLDAHYPRPADLAKLPPDSAAKCTWRARFRREFAKKEKPNRALRLAKGVTSDVFDSIGNLPFIKDYYGKKNSPYYRKNRYVRKQPYGNMAHYSIGIMYQDSLRNNEWHGYSGLEKDLDTYLYGKPGKSRRVALTAGIGTWNIVDPVRGYDVVTTIDVNIQDLLEQEMMAMCQEKGVVWATGMIMEVATGEIKAISNIELNPKKGTYGEAYNRIVDCYEPGSVIKPVSLLIAFEDGLINSVNNTVDTSPFQKTTDPHAPRVKNIKEVMAWSSNTGVARIIFRGYENDPSKFYDRWKSLGLLEKFGSGLAEEKIPRIKKLLPKDSKGNNITMTARHLSLARQAYGYALEISPLYLLSVYNAIANDGVYVRPHLLKALRDENGKDSIIHTPPIRDRICSEHTAKMLRECLYEVVWGKGTGRMVRDNRVAIAGKTGTAFPVNQNGPGYDKSKRRYAFAGFFPYDNPRYSCVVLMLAPAGAGSAASLSGGVLRNTAVKMYARGLLGDNPNYAAERRKSVPVMASGNNNAIRSVRDGFGLDEVKRVHTANASPVLPMATTPKAGKGKGTGKVPLVPDVVGYDAATAVATMERAGLNVVIKGTGRVVTQSLAPRTRFRRGQKILLTLKQ